MAFDAYSLLLAIAVLLISSPNKVAAQSDQVSGASTSTVVSALILNGVIFAVEISLFFVLRPRFRKIYAAKTFLGPSDERVPPQPSGLFNWIPQWFKIPTIEIMHNQGLDAYMWVSYLEMMVSSIYPDTLSL